MSKLTGVELAALDLIIAAKKDGILPEGFLDAAVHVNNIGDVAAAAAAATAVAAAVSAAPTSDTKIAASTPKAGLSLADLVAIRESAVKSRGK